MMSFEPGVVEGMSITHRLLRIVREASEYKDKRGLFKSRSPQVLETLRRVAVIQSSGAPKRPWYWR